MATSLPARLKEKLHSPHFWSPPHRPAEKLDPSELVDYVVVFQYDTSATASGTEAPSRPHLEQQALQAYHDVLDRLTHVGLEWYVDEEATRPGQIFLFVTCPEACLQSRLLRSRAHDWIAGVRAALFKMLQLNPGDLSNISPAERLRLVYHLLTAAPTEGDGGGAGLHPDRHPSIATIFALHNKRFTRQWMRTWSTKWLIDQRDLLAIRDQLGEKVALYFAFLQFYFLWLIPPSAVGLVAYLAGHYYSASLALFIIPWGLTFTEMWARRQTDIATFWGTRNLAAVDEIQPRFTPLALVTDPITGEAVPYFPISQGWLRRMVTAPMLLLGTAFLALVIGFLFALQTLADEHYTGPLQAYATYVPVILYSLLMAKASELYLGLARRMNNYENYRTVDQYENQLSQKIFILSFLVNYLSLFLVAWVYIPFRAPINQWLLQWSAALIGSPRPGMSPKEQTLFEGDEIPHLKMSETSANDLLLNNLFFFVMTGQILSLFQETLIPLATRYIAKGGPFSSGTKSAPPSLRKRLVKRALREYDLPEYDIYDDYSEMVTQFGFVALFSIVWPLTPLVSFINNWVELRSDAVKICMNVRRPTPQRCETIGPWLNNLKLLCWLASITNALLVYQFGSIFPPSRDARLYGNTDLTMALLVVFVTEHLYFSLHWLIKLIIRSFPSAGQNLLALNDYQQKRELMSELAASPHSMATVGSPVPSTPPRRGTGIADILSLSPSATFSPQLNARSRDTTGQAIGEHIISAAFKSQ
ncbi:calcium-activated chloride channel-domain-containing protein [Dimargaris cristalligena]|uniref:Calcium-activated chloride channel-domain-containing protein n=1 Tax=Dimargaris cristalligena TaxID=215637 RepID=A0A4P9ZSD4_9FUNG|nr:calcium-activated chloride channel-domain-containing protein [Dimargaris cristalligena]|eukprot:RKP35711.1 calcium-activated chloride channel-domain-containing protein [Dimargaris cristalligena]